jgi:hypothetical protein
MKGLSVEPGERSALVLSGAAGVEVIGGADARSHLAGGVVDRDDGNRNRRSKRHGTLAGEILKRLLQRCVDGQPVRAR